MTASDIIFRELQSYKRTSGVPVIAVMMDVAASGGYYIALAADTIIAHPTTVTGSIGVIMITLNAEGLMQKIGLAANAIKSGERKDMGSPFRALTPEERAIFQAVIDDLQRQFVGHLVERRKIAPAAAATLADGRIYTADQALAHHLIDQIGYMPRRARRGAPGRRPDRGARRGLQASARVPGDLLRARRQRRGGLRRRLPAHRPRRLRPQVPVRLVAVTQLTV